MNDSRTNRLPRLRGTREHAARKIAERIRHLEKLRASVGSGKLLDLEDELTLQHRHTVELLHALFHEPLLSDEFDRETRPAVFYTNASEEERRRNIDESVRQCVMQLRSLTSRLEFYDGEESSLEDKPSRDSRSTLPPVTKKQKAHTDRAPSLPATLVFIAVLLIAAALILWQQDVIARVHGAAAMLLYLIAALLPAILLFGLFRTIAKVTGKFYGLLIEIGGPGALFFIVLLLLIKVTPSSWRELSANPTLQNQNQSPVTLASRYSQQGSKLVGSGAIGRALQGASVAVSADGETAIVGGWGDNHEAGAAWVWTRNNGVWTQQGPKLVGSGALGFACQGASVALSADGNTAIVGGPRDDGGIGAVWIWRRTGGVWSQQGPKLVGSGSRGTSNQGQSASLSGDGEVAMAGGWLDDNQTGAVWAWRHENGKWTPEQRAGTFEQKLIGVGALGRADQGYSVGLSADGNTAIVGGHVDDDTTGAVWIWTRAGGFWAEQGTKLIGLGAVGKAFQGVAVSISRDGNTAFVGGRKDNNFTGAAWVWTRSEVGTWSPDGPKLVGSGWIGNPEQGFSVSLSADGMNAVVGGPDDNSNAGAAWIWKKVDGLWSQQGPKLFGSGSVGNANQGHSVALSADGSTVLIGGDSDDNGTGAVWVYVDR